MCLALFAGFLAVNSAVRGRVKEGLKESLLRIEEVLNKADAEHNRRHSQLIAILSENSGLKAAMGLYRETTSSDRKALPQARRTIEAQLRELVGMLDYDLLLVADSDGRAVAAHLENGEAKAQSEFLLGMIKPAPVLKIGDKLYETTTVPINLGKENLGSLTVGRNFDFGSLNHVGYAVLLGGDELLLTTFPSQPGWLDSQLQVQCGTRLDGCELEIAGETYLALSVNRASLGKSYRLLSLQPINAAMDQFTRGFKPAFLLIGACSALAVLLLSVIVSRSVSRPLTNLVTHLRDSEKTGELGSDFHTRSSTREVNQLADALNRAAESVKESRQSLQEAYLQFVETMAQALDARDTYTAGHSNRVSEYSVAIATAMELSPERIETINVGAKLHDIGKIGIPDAVLQKPGRLTAEEYELIKQHPRIGKRILEKMGRFQTYLPIVELHHENHDGSGYPHGLKGDEIPLEARIVHVADVYDAISSDRAYRKSMSMQRVLETLKEGAGSQFDPNVVEALLSLILQREVLCEESLATA
jgi:HD-GYP domain-containing protein (c-di-GMP phosphodiesterase class II)